MTEQYRDGDLFGAVRRKYVKEHKAEKPKNTLRPFDRDMARLRQAAERAERDPSYLNTMTDRERESVGRYMQARANRAESSESEGDDT